MPCDNKTISTDITRLSVAEEECPGELPVSPVFYTREPNTYADMGPTISQVAREPITDSSQNQKGTVTDLDAAGGWNEDFTRSNFLRLLQGLFRADIIEQASTQPIIGTAVPITGVVAADSEYTAASGLTRFAVGELIKASGFTVPANNGLKRAVTVAAGALEVAETLIDETPGADATLTTVGKQFATGDLSITVGGGIATIASAANALPDLYPGQWVFIGGDTTATQFANNAPGYVRVRSVIGNTSFIVDDQMLIGGAALVTDAGTGRTVQIFTAFELRNPDSILNQVLRSYTIEHTLGQGVSSTQAQYLKGAVFNEMTLNIPGQDKLNVDVGFLAEDTYYRRGEPGSELVPGTHISAAKEEAINTTKDLVFVRLAVMNENSSSPSFFSYMQDATITVSNNVTPQKALGILGALEMAYGNFTASISGNAYFRSVGVFEAMRSAANVAFTAAFASDENYGWIFDLPLLTISGNPTLEKGNAVMVAIEGNAAESKFGSTMHAHYFNYLPSVANPN